MGLIFNAYTLAISILALISTYVCYRYELYSNFPLTLIGIAVVFPIVFSINGAYKRREVALTHYAGFKANGRAIYFATRDWTPNSTKGFQTKMRQRLYNLLYHCRIMFNTDHSDDDFREKQIYTDFSRISKFIEECRKKGLSGSEVSRCNQYLNKLLHSFENMKHIYQYRTPVTLRAYSKFFIYILPIFYGPYFAYIGRDVPFIILLMIPIIFTVILVSLDNIQDQLENPFDLIGEDDIQLNVEKFIKNLELE